MCLGIPGKIIGKEDQLATVDFNGLLKEVNVSLVDAEVGDYVIVHAGFAIETVKDGLAKEIRNYLGKADE